MIATRLYDPETIERAMTLRERGVEWSAIEAMTGIPRQTGQYHLRKSRGYLVEPPRPAPPPSRKILTPRERLFEDAAEAMSAHFGHTITAADVAADPPTRAATRMRFYAMAWIRWKRPDLSFPRLGKMFGVDHSTVQYAVARARSLYPTAPFCRPDDFNERLDALGLEG